MSEIIEVANECDYSPWWSQVYGNAMVNFLNGGPGATVDFVVKARYKKGKDSYPLVRSGPQGKYMMEWDKGRIICKFNALEVIKWCKAHEGRCFSDP